MHKSVSIFSIFLIVMSLMTFSNIFPTKAMAIEQEGVYYETDETTEYVNDMADYVQDKYQPYANDNNYVKSQSSEFVKKIKCNNINSNLNGLNVNTLPGSTTAEDIGTQALEEDKYGSANAFGNGYERNNGNFDLDCINNNNNRGGQGVPGPEGPQGLTGQQGPSGITHLNDTNTYVVQGGSQINNSTSFNVGTAICDLGDFVINGGFIITGINSNIVEFLNRPILSPVVGSGWEVVIAPAPGSASNAEVTWDNHAICFDNLPAHIP